MILGVTEVLSSRVPDLSILCKHLGKASWILLKKAAYMTCASQKLPPTWKNYMMGSNYILEKPNVSLHMDNTF